MIRDLTNLNWLLEIMDELSPEGQIRLITKALEIKEEEELIQKEKYRNDNISEWKVKELKGQASCNLNQKFSKVRKVLELDDMNSAIVWLATCKALYGSIEKVIEVEYELVKKQREIPMKEYFAIHLPHVDYEATLKTYQKYMEIINKE